MTDRVAEGTERDAPHIEWEPAELEGSVVERLARVVATVPGRIALSGSDGTYTFRELDAASNKVANAVLARVGPGAEPVGVVADNSAQMVVALLGVLKAGKAYMPIDLSYPRQRLQAMLAVSGCRLLATPGVASAQAADSLDVGVEVLDVAATSGEPGDAPSVITGPDSLLNLTFTSGSTGEPKGVVQTHRNALHMSHTNVDVLGLHLGDRLGVAMPVAFGPSGIVLLSTLLAGGAAFMFDVKTQGVTEMSQWMRRKRISVTFLVPTVLRRWLDALEPSDSYPDMRLIETGGEPLYRRDVEAFRAHFSDQCVLQQDYGTAETYLVCANRLTADSVVDGSVVSAGHAVAGKRISILGEDGRELPLGEVGQIAVSSRYLPPGYWRDEEATSRAFVADPEGSDERTYLTGDLGRLREGMLDHLGRMDDMVKIGGLRVMLQEVDGALVELPGIADAASASRPGSDGSPRLVGYVVPNGAAPSASDLREGLAANLPSHMIPTSFVTMEQLPVLPTGKVDRRALPVPDGGRPEQAASFVAPRSSSERAIAKIIEETLDNGRVGVHDNIFDLGIDSLHVTEVAARVGEALGVVLPPVVLLAFPTTARLATAIADGELASVQDSLVFIRAGDGRTPFFCVHGGGGGVYFLQPLSRYLAPEQGVYGLQAEGFDGIPGPFRTVEELAIRYLDEVRSVQSRGPYLLGGLSFGGKVAYEMARLLVAEGETVALLVLLDTELPHPVLGPRRGFRRRLQRIGAMGAGRGAAHLLAGVRARLAAPARRLLIRRYLRLRRPLPERFGLRKYYFLNMMADPAYVAYQPQPYSGRLVVVGTEGTAAEHRTTWGALVREELHVHEVPTDHAGLVRDPHVREVAELLQPHLDEAQRDIEATS